MTSARPPYILRPAEKRDIPVVTELLAQLARWLNERGYDQWSNGGPYRHESLEDAVNRRGTWLLETTQCGALIGTITLSETGDPAFWTATELAAPALYLSKLAVDRAYAGQELGRLLLSWARDYAYRIGVRAVRLDAWRTNTDLHRYYIDRGWTLLRTVSAPGRNAGALFELPPAPLPQSMHDHLLERSA